MTKIMKGIYDGIRMEAGMEEGRMFVRVYLKNMQTDFMTAYLEEMGILLENNGKQIQLSTIYRPNVLDREYIYERLETLYKLLIFCFDFHVKQTFSETFSDI